VVEFVYFAVLSDLGRFNRTFKEFNFKSLNLLKRLAGDALQISVHTDHRLDNAMNLGFALRPEPRHHFAFFFEINLHLGEFLNDSLDTVPELGAGQVPVDQFHFRLLSLVGLSRGADFDQRLTERNGKRHYKAEIRDPDAVNAVKGLDAFRQSSRDEDGNI